MHQHHQNLCSRLPVETSERVEIHCTSMDANHEVRTGVWWGDLGKKSLGNPGVEGGITLKWIFKKQGGEACTGLMWLKTGTGGGPL
jgi:hypothetical protein